MVKAGTLPKLEDRMVHPEDIYVFAGPDELGVYGGTNRITSHSAYSWLGWNFTGGMGTCYSEDTDRLQSWPNGCKQATVSEDGSIYTIELRRNYHWSDGVPITMRDVEFAWELNYDKELNPKPFDKITDPVTGNVPKFVVVDDHTYQLQFDTAYWAVIEGQAYVAASTATKCTTAISPPSTTSRSTIPSTRMLPNSRRRWRLAATRNGLRSGRESPTVR